MHAKLLAKTVITERIENFSVSVISVTDFISITQFHSSKENWVFVFLKEKKENHS